MKNKIQPVFFFCVLLTLTFKIITNCNAQTSWEVVNDSEHIYAFHDVIVNSDTTYYMLGGFSGYGLVKYDKQGNKLWTKPTFGCCENLVKGFDNYLYTFGMDTCIGTQTNQVFVAKHNLEGDTIWTKKLGTPGSTLNTAMGCFMNDTALLVAVSSTIYSSLQKLTLIKLDTSGNVIWGDYYPPYLFPYDIKEFNGDYKIAGGYGVLTIDKDGNEVTDEPTEVDLRSLSIDEDGNYFASNLSEIYKLDTGLNVDWLIDVSDSIDCFHSRLVDSNLYITGHYNDFTDDRSDQVLLGKINADDGSVVWIRNYGGRRDENGYYVQPTLDKGFIIAASTESWPKDKENGYLIKTDNLGYTSNCADSLGFFPDTIVACAGVEKTVFNNSIGSYADYTWYFDGDSVHTGIEPLLISSDSIGDHLLSLVSCEDTLETFLRIIPWPNPVIEYSIYNDSVQFYNDSDDYPYWNFGDGYTSYEKEPSHIYQENGDYIVTLTLTNEDCWAVDDTTLTITITSIDQRISNQLKVYPNPGNGQVFIEIPEELYDDILEVSVHSKLGQRLFNTRLKYNKKSQLNLGNLTDGTYILTVSTKNRSYFKLLIINSF